MCNLAYHLISIYFCLPKILLQRKFPDLRYFLLPIGSTAVPQMQPWVVPVVVVCVLVLSCVVVIIIVAGIIIVRRRQSGKYNVLSYDCVVRDRVYIQVHVLCNICWCHFLFTIVCTALAIWYIGTFILKLLPLLPLMRGLVLALHMHLVFSIQKTLWTCIFY